MQKIITMAVLASLFACGGTYPLMRDNVKNRAALLRDYCRTHEITQPDILTAENLYGRAQEVAEEKPDEAAFLMDRALVTYRLALLKYELELKRKEQTRLEMALQGSREELDYYSQVLAELQEMRAVPADSTGADKAEPEAADE